MKKIFSCFMIAMALLQQSCSKGSEETPAPAVSEMEKNRNKVLQGYSELVFANYTDVVITAEFLQVRLQNFVSSPSEQTLEDAKDAWITARSIYSQTETFRFFNDPNPIKALEGNINSWPLDAKYIDYTVADVNTGIINSKTFGPITKQSVLAAHQKGNAQNISCGYHAIEFLLWGQDTSVADAGQRPYTDYILTSDSTHSNPKRRGEYLLAVANLLVDDVTTVTNAWKPNTQNYRAAFVDKGDSALMDIIRGMANSGKEGLSEKMSFALEQRDEASEQSCFSDQTYNDIYYTQLGIANVYKGNYVTTGNITIDVYSIESMLIAADTEMNDKMLSNLSATENAAGFIVINQPFDQCIADGNTSGNILVQNAINALAAQSNTLVSVAKKLTGALLILH